jgi:hypothetical protein
MIIELAKERMRRMACPVQSGRTHSDNAAARFQDPEEYYERLWQEFTAITEFSDLSTARVLLMGFEGSQLNKIRRMVRDARVASCANCCVDQLQDATEMRGSFSHLVVNFDAIGTTHEAVDALFAFRARQKEVAIVLVTALIAEDDFDSSRTSICDVTLRSPLSPKRLRDGLVGATLNGRMTEALAF